MPTGINGLKESSCSILQVVETKELHLIVSQTDTHGACGLEGDGHRLPVDLNVKAGSENCYQGVDFK